MKALLIDQYTNSLPWVNIDHFRCLLIVFSGTSESYSEFILRLSWLIARFTRQVIRLGNHRQPYFRSLAMVRWSPYSNTILSHPIEIKFEVNEFWNRLIFVFRTCAMSCVYPLPYVSWMRGTARNWQARRYACNCTCQWPKKITLATWRLYLFLARVKVRLGYYQLTQFQTCTSKGFLFHRQSNPLPVLVDGFFTTGPEPYFSRARRQLSY